MGWDVIFSRFIPLLGYAVSIVGAVDCVEKGLDKGFLLPFLMAMYCSVAYCRWFLEDEL